MKSNILDEFQAAALVGMSPTLLEFLSKHQVKWQDKRKLAVARKDGRALFFDESELKAYDAWLQAPWPAKSGKRPRLPDGIREEIRREANLECALCKSSGEAGEAAHIVPVADTKSNHPHNLIWLCANHHTKLDNGSFGPTGADNEVIVGLKAALHHFQRAAWRGQAEVSRQIAATLSLCGQMQDQLASAKTTVEVQAVQRVATQALSLLPDLASQDKSAATRAVLDRMTQALSLDRDTTAASTADRLRTAVSFEQEFLLESGLVQCPLCLGQKSHNGNDCPVCYGDGAVSKELEVDLSDFDEIDCQHCGGAGYDNGEDCPVCHGEKQLERRFADRIDFSQYETVECPRCDGSGYWRGDDCPVCHGEMTMTRYRAEQVDLDDFDEVDCPLCKGTGQFHGNDCPECRGDKRMQARHADQVDLRNYRLRRCPLCKGRRIYHGEDCPACRGEGEMFERDAEWLDLSQFDLVNCPRCAGSGIVNYDDCPACAGEKQMQRRFADRMG